MDPEENDLPFDPNTPTTHDIIVEDILERFQKSQPRLYYYDCLAILEIVKHHVIRFMEMEIEDDLDDNDNELLPWYCRHMRPSPGGHNDPRPVSEGSEDVSHDTPDTNEDSSCDRIIDYIDDVLLVDYSEGCERARVICQFKRGCIVFTNTGQGEYIDISGECKRDLARGEFLDLTKGE